MRVGYTAGMQNSLDNIGTRWHFVRDVEQLVSQALSRVERAAQQAIQARDAFHLVLSGGTTPQALYVRFNTLETDWRKWHIWFGDERCLPVDDVARNSRMAWSSWLHDSPIPAQQIHLIPAELGAESAALAYSQALAQVGLFDLVLLGLGEDGHTASLFPGHDWGTCPDSAAVLPVHGAPKPPADRVSLSARRLSQTRAVLFLVAGAGKFHAVAAWRRGEPIPAMAIRPDQGVDVLVEHVCINPVEDEK
jgi:6-phosphogluconolactonase